VKAGSKFLLETGRPRVLKTVDPLLFPSVPSSTKPKLAPIHKTLSDSLRTAGTRAFAASLRCRRPPRERPNLGADSPNPRWLVPHRERLMTFAIPGARS
jgi:hypothetical protein